MENLNLVRWEVGTRRSFGWENLNKREYLENLCGTWTTVIKMDCKEI